jgi:hypothetical protein
MFKIGKAFLLRTQGSLFLKGAKKHKDRKEISFPFAVFA